MTLYEKAYEYMAIKNETFFSGVGILSPTTYGYEDAYADGYVKVVDYCDEKTSRISTCKVKENSKGELFFRHNNHIYKFDDFMMIVY